MMEHSRDSKLKNSNKLGKRVGNGSVKIKNATKFSRGCKKSFKSPRQSSTIETWLEKGTSSSNGDTQSDQSSKLKNIENISKTYNHSNTSVNDSENEKQSSGLSDTELKKENNAKKVLKKDSSSSSSKSKSKNKYCAYPIDFTDTEMPSKENMAKTKFKNILSSFAYSVDGKLSTNSQTNAKLLKLSEHYSNSFSRIKKSTAKEIVLTPTKQNRSPEDLRRSPGNLTSPVFNAVTSGRRLFSQRDEADALLGKNTEDNKLDTIDGKRKEGNLKTTKLNKMKELSKCSSKKVTKSSKKAISSTSEIKDKVKQTRQDDIAVSSTRRKKSSIDLLKRSPSASAPQNNTKLSRLLLTPTKQNKSPDVLRRSPRNLTSPVFSAVTSARRLFSQSDEADALLRKNTEENKLDIVDGRHKEGNLKINKLNRMKESSKCSSKKVTEDSKTTNSSTSKTKRKAKQTRQDDIAVSSMKRKKSLIDLLKRSPSASASQNNTKLSTSLLTPTKQNRSPEDLRRLPRNLTSPVFSAVTSARRLFSQSDEADALLRKNTEENKLDTVDGRHKEGNLKINKLSRMKESSKCSSKKVTEDSKTTNSSTSKTKRKAKQTRQDDIAVPSTRRKKSSVDSLKHSPSVSAPQSNTKLFTWLTKDTTSKSRLTRQSDKSSKKSDSLDPKTANKTGRKYKKLNVKINSNTSKEQNKEPLENKSISKKKKITRTLDNYVNESSKDSDKRKFSRSESNESCELPSFVKNKKIKTSSDSFKKYGVTVPSVEEILKEKEDLAQYKNQVESFKDLDDKFFELPFSVKDLKNKQVIEYNILDCKHLSDCDIEEGFHRNFDYISAIFHGKQYSERHERFFEANVRSYAFTVKDLCYNTSTIVFSFEQKELLLSMLKKEFDPDDKKTLYFFQVLLPELCLKIFMDTHNMTYDEAVNYLDARPVVD